MEKTIPALPPPVQARYVNQRLTEPQTWPVNRIDTWEFTFADGVFEHLSESLSPTEMARADQFKFETPRLQFLRCRSCLRLLLSLYLGEEPCEIQIQPNPVGKPELVDHALQFNLSHTADELVIAVSDRVVGIDIEEAKPRDTMDDLVRRFFHRLEQEAYFETPEANRLEAFYRGWTGKEAVLKGIGIGLRNLDLCILNLDLSQPVSILGPVSTLHSWAITSWPSQLGNPISLAWNTSEVTSSPQPPSPKQRRGSKTI
ncbi:MAG: 4'-phosphopantetheinyl transferase family protein [Fimbriiglobus sp.]